MSSRSIGFGAFAGLSGGTVFCLILGMSGLLPLVGLLIGQPTPLASYLLHMVTSAFIGGLFAALLGRKATCPWSGLRRGLIYGAGWWIIGPVTLVPLLLGDGLAAHWSGGALVALLPSLFGHLVFGAVLGMTYGWLRAVTDEAGATACEPPSFAGLETPRRASEARDE